MPKEIVEFSVPLQEYTHFESSPLLYYTTRIAPSRSDVSDFVLLKKSLDARSKQIKYIIRMELYTDGEHPEPLQMPEFATELSGIAHIIGFGPAGIFAALQCLEQGIRPIVIERGKAVKDRRRDVARLNREGHMNPESNYCFGEGGAGTFSDGKLYTRSHKRGKIRSILEYLVLHGANENIMYEAHPHIGTNKLPAIIERLRQTIEDHGGLVRFESRLNDIQLSGDRVERIRVNDDWEDCQHLILATGHSARDIYYLLNDRGVALEAKPFAMGFRIEHPQSLIDRIQYHSESNAQLLPPASYSLVTQVKGKGAFSFCMCPGGIIAPAATDNGEVVVNGWSPSKRNGNFANSGWVTEIGEEEWVDFAEHGALAGLEFQKHIEHKAYEMGGGELHVPAQNLTDYIAQRISNEINTCSYHPGTTSVDLNKLYPKAVNYRLREGLRTMTKRLKGFAHKDAVVLAPESRTSAPVRIPRTPDLHHPDVLNLYPCGEGAGYAGGILSAAMDGVRCAKALITQNKKGQTEA